jgi:hypothetical protein
MSSGRSKRIWTTINNNAGEGNLEAAELKFFPLPRARRPLGSCSSVQPKKQSLKLRDFEFGISTVMVIRTLKPALPLKNTFFKNREIIEYKFRF